MQHCVVHAIQAVCNCAAVFVDVVALQYKPYNYHRKPAQRVLNEVECVICMTLIEDTHAGCMITPCDHIFHRDCLQQWMDVKMECPSCRASIP